MELLWRAKVWSHAGTTLKAPQDIAEAANTCGFAVFKSGRVGLALPAEATSEFKLACTVMRQVHARGALAIDTYPLSAHELAVLQRQCRGLLDPLLVVVQDSSGRSWLRLNPTALEHRTFLRSVQTWVASVPDNTQWTIPQVNAALVDCVPPTLALFKLAECDTSFLLQLDKGSVWVSGALAAAYQQAIKQCSTSATMYSTVDAWRVLALHLERCRVPQSLRPATPSNLARLMRSSVPLLKIVGLTTSTLTVLRRNPFDASVRNAIAVLKSAGYRGVSLATLAGHLGQGTEHFISLEREQGRVIGRYGPLGLERFYWVGERESALAFEGGFTAQWVATARNGTEIGTKAIATALIQRHLPFLDRQGWIMSMQQPVEETISAHTIATRQKAKRRRQNKAKQTRKFLTISSGKPRPSVKRQHNPPMPALKTLGDGAVAEPPLTIVQDSK